VLLFSIGAGWIALLPSEFNQLGKHVIAGATFVSNLLLWSESGYFDNASETKPLLHLWSLGIEEQFYIVFPVLLLGLWGRKQRPVWLLGLLALLSFSVNLYTSKFNLVADFYAPHTRFWELMLGGILSIWYQQPPQQ
jgi:peptidoglycan/LPS O-acetylase OafA/YrhL